MPAKAWANDGIRESSDNLLLFVTAEVFIAAGLGSTIGSSAVDCFEKLESFEKRDNCGEDRLSLGHCSVNAHSAPMLRSYYVSEACECLLSLLVKSNFARLPTDEIQPDLCPELAGELTLDRVSNK
jgi:hypothetical protein